MILSSHISNILSRSKLIAVLREKRVKYVKHNRKIGNVSTFFSMFWQKGKTRITRFVNVIVIQVRKEKRQVILCATYPFKWRIYAGIFHLNSFGLVTNSLTDPTTLHAADLRDYSSQIFNIHNTHTHI